MDADDRHRNTTEDPEEINREGPEMIKEEGGSEMKVTLHK